MVFNAPGALGIGLGPALQILPGRAKKRASEEALFSLLQQLTGRP
jgi:hypothetical protein